MHTRWILVAAAAATAATCYRPAGDQPCSIACDQQNPCPGAMSCISGRCHAVGDVACAPVDSPNATTDVPSGSSGSACYGSGDVQICFTSPPTGNITSADARAIDTTTGNGCVITTGLRAGPSSVCVLAGSAVDLASGITIEATGTRPLVIVADDTITIGGTVTVASTAAGTIGAGADSCTSGAGQEGQGGGGGAGGSHGSLGGVGGAGTAGRGGDVGLPALTGVRGGCSGGAGGADGAGAGAGAPGAGGGAVYLLARNQVTVDGFVNASGAGGGAAGAMTAGAGGGGGGAGGYIGIDAPQIVIGGLVLAVGGGGGGGGAHGETSFAQPGAETNTCSAASGGNGAIASNTIAGNGGPGSVDTTKNGTDGGSTIGGSLPNGGGGGGGGVGVVRVFGALSGSTCPAPKP